MVNAKNKEKISRIRAWLKTGSINLFGLPFAGKDTHGKELAELLGGVVIGGGDIIRNSPELKHIHEYVGTGVLAPTEEYLRIVLPYFSRKEFQGKPLILSSVGRWHGEEAGVLEATAESGHPLLMVIYLKITEEEMRRRWRASQQLRDRGQRKDDAEHTLDVRLKEFRKKTIPVINFYSDQGMLIEINGMLDIDKVRQDIIDKLNSRASKSLI